MEESNELSSEEQMKRDFPTSYREISTSDEDDFDRWAGTIEFKLNRQGQLIMGIGAGLAATLLLVGLQGKVVINVARIQKGIVEYLNSGTGGDGSGATTPAGPVTYARPTGHIDESKGAPVDDAVLEELRATMDATIDKTLPGEIG